MKLYAFWKHDTFPYILGGPVSKMTESGAVETENFGKGYYFKPFKVLPLTAGLALREKLKKLESEHRAELESFRNTWDAEAAKLREAVDNGKV